jgi:outer membrane protein assembly factor BamB
VASSDLLECWGGVGACRGAFPEAKHLGELRPLEASGDGSFVSHRTERAFSSGSVSILTDADDLFSPSAKLYALSLRCVPASTGSGEGAGVRSSNRSRDVGAVATAAICVVILLVVSGVGVGSPREPRASAATVSGGLRAQVVLPPGGDFPTYLGSIERTSSSQGTQPENVTNAPDIHLLWNTTVGGEIVSQPVESNGVVYFGDNNGNEYAVNAINGSVYWDRPLGQDANDSGCAPSVLGVTSTATIAGSTLYVDGGNPYFYALNDSTGAIEWRSLIGGSDNLGFYDWSSPLIYNGNAYVGISSDCDHPLVPAGLVEFSLTNGSILSYFNSSGPDINGSSIWGSPSVNPLTNTIYVTTGNGYSPNPQNYSESIVALNASTLNVTAHWQVPASAGPGDSDFGVTPTLFTTDTGISMVTAANKNGFLYGFYQSNLTLAWQARVCCQMDEDDHFSTAWGGGYVFAVGAETSIGGLTFNSSVHAFDPNNGTEVWKQGFPETSYPGYAAPLYVNGVLIVADGNSLLFLNAHTGHLLNQIAVGGPTQAAASVARGEVFVGSRDGSLLAYDVQLESAAAPSISTGTVPFVVSFMVNAAGGLPPYRYAWTFGDNGSSALQAPAHEYLTVGTFTVEVRVTDQAGNTTADFVSVSVSAATPPPKPSEILEILAIVVGIAVVAGAYLAILRLHRRPPSVAGSGAPVQVGSGSTPLVQKDSTNPPDVPPPTAGG